jgi:hypothetical protein
MSAHSRRVANGEQVSGLAGLALKTKSLVNFSGYWQWQVAAHKFWCDCQPVQLAMVLLGVQIG